MPNSIGCVPNFNTNLIPKELHNFVKFINIFTTIDEDFLIPFELGAKYGTKGLTNFPFKVLTAEECLNLI
jgi:hypothetical protein